MRILALPGDKKASEMQSNSIEVIYGDIREQRDIEEAVRGVQIVYHLAAVVTDWAPKTLFEQVNIEGARNICEASLKNGIERLIEMSTNDVFGLVEDVVIDESFDYKHWRGPYADTKKQPKPYSG